MAHHVECFPVHETGGAPAQFCRVDGCEDAAFRDGLCFAHKKRQQRGRPLSEPKQVYGNPWRRLFEAALLLGNAEEDEEFELARDRLRKAALSYHEEKKPEDFRQLAVMRFAARRRNVAVPGQLKLFP